MNRPADAARCRISGSALDVTFVSGCASLLQTRLTREESAMLEFPHHYAVAATGAVEGDVELTSDRLPVLRSASPAAFDGPGDRWSPETLLVGAVADCFVLTFRAVARASKLPWTSIRCDVTGTLDRVDRAAQFTDVDLHARLAVPAGTDPSAARRALEKAERNCLISNSLKATVHLHLDVDVAEPLHALAGA